MSDYEENDQFDFSEEPTENKPTNLEAILVQNCLVSVLNMMQISKYLDRTLDSAFEDFNIVLGKAIGNRKNISVNEIPSIFESALNYLNEKQKFRDEVKSKIDDMTYDKYLKDILKDLKVQKKQLEKKKEKTESKIRKFLGKKEKNNE